MARIAGFHPIGSVPTRLCVLVPKNTRFVSHPDARFGCSPGDNGTCPGAVSDITSPLPSRIEGENQK